MHISKSDFGLLLSAHVLQYSTCSVGGGLRSSTGGAQKVQRRLDQSRSDQRGAKCSLIDAQMIAHQSLIIAWGPTAGLLVGYLFDERGEEMQLPCLVRRQITSRSRAQEADKCAAEGRTHRDLAKAEATRYTKMLQGTVFYSTVPHCTV